MRRVIDKYYKPDTSHMRIEELKNVPSEIRDLHNDGEGMNFELDPVFNRLHASAFMKEVRTMAKRHGLEMIGRGKYGLLFRVPGKDYVLKVYSADDSLYTKWASWCMSNPSKWVPKFRGSITKISEQLNAVRMERLDKYTGGRAGSEVMANLMVSYKMVRVIGPTSTYWKKAEAAFPGIMEDDDFAKLAAFLEGHRDEIDMHEDNLMMRGNQVVIIDTLASQLIR